MNISAHASVKPMTASAHCFHIICTFGLTSMHMEIDVLHWETIWGIIRATLHTLCAAGCKAWLCLKDWFSFGQQNHLFKVKRSVGGHGSNTSLDCSQIVLIPSEEIQHIMVSLLFVLGRYNWQLKQTKIQNCSVLNKHSCCQAGHVETGPYETIHYKSEQQM